MRKTIKITVAVPERMPCYLCYYFPRQCHGGAKAENCEKFQFA